MTEAPKPWVITFNLSSDCAYCATIEGTDAHLSELAIKAWGLLSTIIPPPQGRSFREPCSCYVGYAHLPPTGWDGVKKLQIIEKPIRKDTGRPLPECWAPKPEAAAP